MSIFEDDETFQFSEYKHQIADQNLFNLFAYGVYSPNLQLNPKQDKKLKLLTLITLCAQMKKLAFDRIQSECYLKSFEEVQDLIIDTIQSGILIGKIDEQKKELLVSWTISRDVSLQDSSKIKAKLSRLHERTQQLRQQL